MWKDGIAVVGLPISGKKANETLEISVLRSTNDAFLDVLQPNRQSRALKDDKGNLTFNMSGTTSEDKMEARHVQKM